MFWTHLSRCFVNLSSCIYFQKVFDSEDAPPELRVSCTITFPLYTNGQLSILKHLLLRDHGFHVLWATTGYHVLWGAMYYGVPCGNMGYCGVL